jgi:hypothetical protein
MKHRNTKLGQIKESESESESENYTSSDKEKIPKSQ